jgi:hypothetical protein
MNWRFIGLARISAELYLRRLNPWALAIGLIWLLGAALFISALSMHMGPPASADIRPALSDIPAAGGPNRSHLIAEPSTARNLERFMGTLGDGNHTEQQVQSLFVMAKGLQLALPQGHYRLNCDQGSEVCRYRIGLPVRGSYVRVRSFLEELLMAIPFASIDDLTFKRETITDDEVEVMVNLSLFTRDRMNSVAGPKVGDQ